MFLSLQKKSKYILVLFTAFLLSFQSAHAAGPPDPSLFSNPLAVVLIILMLVLLIVIGILASIMIGAADVKLKKRKKEKAGMVAVMIFLLLLPGTGAWAQSTSTETVQATANTIGGMPVSTFYVMATVIFLELLLIIAMLINIRFLLAAEKEKLTALSVAEKEELKKTTISWWGRMNNSVL